MNLWNLRKKNLIIACLLICLSIIFTACSQQSSNAINTSNKSNELKVHYIDVGQGDSILVQTKDKNILIDAGTRKSSDNLINYLKKQHIKKIRLCNSHSSSWRSYRWNAKGYWWVWN